MNSTDVRAGRGRRLGAAIIDFIVTGSVALAAIWPLGIFEHQEAYEFVQFITRLFALLCGSYLLVNGWLLYRNAQTVGKRLLGIRIVRHSNDQLLPFWLLLIRAFAVLAVMAIPYVMLLALVDVLFIFTPKRRCLHDYLVGSTVQNVVAGNA